MRLSQEDKNNRKEARRKEKWNKEHKIINGVDYKLCFTHKELFPKESSWMLSTAEYFYNNDKNSLDGLSNICIRCNRIRSLNNRNKNIEKARASWRNWYRKEGNAERIKEYNREYYEADPKRKLQIAKEFRQNFPEIVRGYCAIRREKNHNINKQEWGLCKDYFKNDSGEWVCAYCGRTEKDSYKLYNCQLHKEHVIHDGENDLSNCVPACQECNSEKHIFAFDDWYNSENSKYTQERYNRIQKWLHEDYKKYIIIKKPRKKYTRKAS